MTFYTDHDRKDLSNIDFPNAFFEDEVREGFFITTMMKRYWAAQIKVLSVVAEICRRHEISWFADYGTLMGAVRHEGYIPWDDDLDICMFRSDWNRFFDVAKKELPKEYIIMTIQEQEDYRELIGRVTNSHSIDFSPDHLEEFYGCPYTVGVDIFPLDGLYDDPVREADRKARAQRVLDAHGIVQGDGENSQLLETVLPQIEKDNNVHLDKGAGLERKLVLLLDRIYSECSDVGASNVALMRLYMSYGNHIYDRKMFETYIELPFENTFIRVPARYDEKLKADYGDYMHVSKMGGVHDYPVFAEQELMLKEYAGKNPYRYTMDNHELLSSVGRYIMKATTPKEGKKRRSIVFLPCRFKWWNTMEQLWEKAIDDPLMDVTVIPLPFYDRDYSGAFSGEHFEKELFPEYLDVLDYKDYDIVKEHPDIIVIQVPYDGWSTVMATPEQYYSRNLVRCTDELIYIPCFDPDDSEVDGDKAEVTIKVLAEQPAVVNSDRIILKSERMKQVYIKKLIELTGEPTRDYWNQKIVLENELDWVNEPAGKRRHLSKTCDIFMDPEWYALVGDVMGKKVIVYFISISFILQGGDKAINKIRRSLEIFSEHADKIQVVLLPQEAVLTCLESIDNKLWESFVDLTHGIGKTWKNCVYDEAGVAVRHVDKWDAFYGDRGRLPRLCVLKSKPVMIQNIDV